MRGKGFLVLILIAGILMPGIAFGADGVSGIVLFPSFSMRQETGVAAGDNTSYPLNIRAGYITAGGLYLGMMYSKVAASGTNAGNESSYGNSIGFFTGPVSFIATYYFVSSTTETSLNSGVVTRSGGNGYQFDLSMLLPISAKFSLGPVLSFKSFTYSTREDSTGISNAPHSETFLFPAFGLLFVF